MLTITPPAPPPSEDSEPLEVPGRRVMMPGRGGRRAREGGGVGGRSRAPAQPCGAASGRSQPRARHAGLTQHQLAQALQLDAVHHGQPLLGDGQHKGDAAAVRPHLPGCGGGGGGASGAACDGGRGCITARRQRRTAPARAANQPARQRASARQAAAPSARGRPRPPAAARTAAERTLQPLWVSRCVTSASRPGRSGPPSSNTVVSTRCWSSVSSAGRRGRRHTNSRYTEQCAAAGRG